MPLPNSAKVGLYGSENVAIFIVTKEYVAFLYCTC
jgi:hypothetical protein